MGNDSSEPLKWRKHGKRRNKGKKKSQGTKKMVKSYATESVKKKLSGDAMKARKIATTKRRRMEKTIVVKDEDVDIVNVVEEEDIDVVFATFKKRKKE